MPISMAFKINNYVYICTVLLQSTCPYPVGPQTVMLEVAPHVLERIKVSRSSLSRHQAVYKLCKMVFGKFTQKITGHGARCCYLDDREAISPSPYNDLDMAAAKVNR